VFFGATGDGASSQDFRTYSVEKTSGYLVADAHNVYSAGNQNSTASLYTTLFPAGVSAPAIQSTLPTGSATQAGTSVAGAAGFRWNEVEIMRLGTVVTWKINGTLIATVDTTNFTLPTGGNNIFLGMSDTSLGAGTPASLFATYDFTLIDNLAVTAVPEPSATVVSIMATFGLVASRRRRVV
jgi:hypothetical protein